MQLTEDVVKWLKENAYAVKDKDYWFLNDFPSDQIPDRLEIPMNKQAWRKWQTGAIK